jgi:hypothetical protein
LTRIIKTASFIIGAQMDSLDIIYNKRALKRIQSILKDEHHPIMDYLEVLPLGKRLLSIKATTSRMANGFISSAVRLHNSNTQRH